MTKTLDHQFDCSGIQGTNLKEPTSGLWQAMKAAAIDEDSLAVFQLIYRNWQRTWNGRNTRLPKAACQWFDIVFTGVR